MSTVKLVIPALVTVFNVVPGLQVVDGPAYDPQITHLLVGWNGGEFGAISGRLDLADYGASQDRESYDVACLLSHWCGNRDVPTVRAGMLDDFTALRAALRATPTLGVPNVNRAAFTAFDVEDDLYETGEVAAMKLTVTVDAWS